MNKRTKSIVPMLITGLLTGVLLVAMLGFKSTPATAHMVPVPCDFTTGGGFVITDNNNHANFGLVAGCKHGGFFGHVNFVDHDTTGMFAGMAKPEPQLSRSGHRCAIIRPRRALSIGGLAGGGPDPHPHGS